MNKEESLALHEQGRDVWNEWAEAMHAERAALEAAGKWVDSVQRDDWNDSTREWRDKAAADFTIHRFGNDVDFEGFSFPHDVTFSDTTFAGTAKFTAAKFFGEAKFTSTKFLGDSRFDEANFLGYVGFQEATFLGDAWFAKAQFSGYAGWFTDATFLGDAWFTGAKFSHDAWFLQTTFSGTVWFHGAKFSSTAWFTGVTFKGDARFSEVTYSGDALFTQSTFEASVVFDHACFENSADFKAVLGKSVLSLAGVTFIEVPNFWNAHFDEAPRLDNLHIGPVRFVKFTVPRIKAWFKGDPNLSARWRALKRLAVQGHDHMREQEFFKGEVTARRFGEDKPWHAVFWFGLFYQALSDFGRSTLRPLFWLAVCVAGFACFYSGQLSFETGKPMAGYTASWERASTFVIGGPPPSSFCVVGKGDPLVAALGLSLRNTVPFAGIGSSDKLKQIYACLYGIHTDETLTPGRLPKNFTPKIPDAVAFVSVLQIVLSTVLLFLLLLAVRNHFRIK